MRISFDCQEKSSGLLFTKTYSEVVLTVLFTEEELAIIHKHRLKDMLIMERDADAVTANRYKREPEKLASLVDSGQFQLTVRNLMRGPDHYACHTPAHAKVYQTKLMDHLKDLKATLAGSVEAPEALSYEL